MSDDFEITKAAKNLHNLNKVAEAVLANPSPELGTCDGIGGKIPHEQISLCDNWQPASPQEHPRMRRMTAEEAARPVSPSASAGGRDADKTVDDAAMRIIEYVDERPFLEYGDATIRDIIRKAIEEATR